MRHDPGTQRMLDAAAVVERSISRHLGPAGDRTERSFAAVCPPEQAALEISITWSAPPERRSLIDLALDAAHRALSTVDVSVKRDRLAGDTNVRIAAGHVGITVFGPGGEEIGDRLLLTGLGPCRDDL